jgi:hypothetical protein
MREAGDAPNPRPVPPPAPQAGTVERSTPVVAAEEPDAALALDIVLSFTAECMVENLALGLPGSGAFLCGPRDGTLAELLF